MKPFDLEAAKRGEPVCLGTGDPARIICFDRGDIGFRSRFCIVALVNWVYREDVMYFDENGYCANGIENEESYELLKDTPTSKQYSLFMQSGE